MKKITRWLGALLGMGVTASMGVEGMPLAITPQHRMNEAGWKSRHQRFVEQAKNGGFDLVFLGDSITQAWEDGGRDVWARYYGHRAALNLGISGDRTEHVLWRMGEGGELEGLNPKAVVVMLGTNNTGHRKDPVVDVTAGMDLILKNLKAKFPNARILLLGIFHRGADPKDPLRVRNAEINAEYAKLVDGKTVIYADIGAAFLEPDGTLSKKVMPDLLHLSPEGYRRWAEAMDPHLSKLLGDQPVAPATVAKPK